MMKRGSAESPIKATARTKYKNGVWYEFRHKYGTMHLIMENFGEHVVKGYAETLTERAMCEANREVAA